MPRPSKGARLYWRAASRKSDGKLRNRAGWFIRDGSRFLGPVGGEGEREKAEKALAEYIAQKYTPLRTEGQDPENALVADVISIYLTDIVPTHARPEEAAARLDRILDHFGTMHLRQITGHACRAYTASRTSPNAARRELEDLRAALNHFRKEGYCLAVPAVTLPPKPPARERWLTRSEAARLLWALWRMRQKWKGKDSDRKTGRHVARFVLVALYTGTRSAAICAAAMRPVEGTGYVDLERGVFYRRAPGSRQTKKRQPPVPIPPRLLAHLRRWERLGIARNHIVEWNGKPVKSVRKALRAGRIAAGLGDDVTAHTLRHTAPTWAMQNGADIWQAAGYFGMTVETLERVYGHHHPDYLAGAVAAISAPQKPHRKGGNKGEQTHGNVIRIAGN